MSDSTDVHLQLKKRARRRLIGALAFAGLAAVVLPMVMDDEPKQQVQDVQIRIPGQEQAAFNPKIVKPAATSESVEKAAAPVAQAPVSTAKVGEKPAEKKPEKAAEKPHEKPLEKSAEKPLEKTVEKAPAKANDKLPEKTVKAIESDQQRAAAILAGKTTDSASANGQYVILIGAFSNQANVKQLQTKIGELGIKVFTETLNSPEGQKTRVRAGPFTSRDAADKALDKMKRIGVNGVVSAKQ